MYATTETTLLAHQPTTPMVPHPRARAQQDFAALLGQSRSSLAMMPAHSTLRMAEKPTNPMELFHQDNSAGDSEYVQVRQAASEFVSLVFINPILKEVRENSHAAPPFAPTSGEKQFGALLDAKLAGNITEAANFPIIDAVAHRMLNKPQPQPAPDTPGGFLLEKPRAIFHLDQPNGITS